MKSLIRSHRLWLLVIIPLTVIFLLTSFVKTGSGALEDEKKIYPADKELYAVFPVELPEKLSFAGEPVPLEYFDVRESLDMELLRNTFFHSQTFRYIKLANRYFPEIESILKKMGIPDDFKYLVVAESGLTNAVSPVGAVGFWQMKEKTGEEYGLEINSEVDERYNLSRSTEAACLYLVESYEKYGSWTMAAASYNVGRKGIDRQVERQKENNYYDLLLPEETARYLFRILSFKLIMESPADYGFNISKKELYKPIPYSSVEIDSTVTDFADFAKEYGTNYKLLKYLNPWLRDVKLTNTNGNIYEIRVPQKRNL